MTDVGGCRRTRAQQATVAAASGTTCACSLCDMLKGKVRIVYRLDPKTRAAQVLAETQNGVRKA